MSGPEPTAPKPQEPHGRCLYNPKLGTYRFTKTGDRSVGSFQVYVAERVILESSKRHSWLKLEVTHIVSLLNPDCCIFNFFKKNIFFQKFSFYVYWFFSCMYACILPYLCLVPEESRIGHQIPEACCEPLYRSMLVLGSNPGTVEGQ